VYSDRVLRLTRFAPLLIAAAVAASACTASSTAPSSAPFSQTDVKIGAGDPVASGNTVTVDYTGWLYDPSKSDFKGLVFDTSIGKDPFTFTIGSGQVIAGWEQGVPGMKVGGLRRLIIPPSLAYGAVRSGPIPPNATLLFEIQLLSVAPPPDSGS